MGKLLKGLKKHYEGAPRAPEADLIRPSGPPQSPPGPPEPLPGTPESPPGPELPNNQPLQGPCGLLDKVFLNLPKPAGRTIGRTVGW